MVSHLAQIAILSGAGLVDDITTAIACNKEGIRLEKQPWRRKLMNKFGVWKSMPLQTAISQAAYYAPIVATYLLEKHFNPDATPSVYQWAWLGITCPPVYCAAFNTFYLASKAIGSLTAKRSSRTSV